ncbi:ArsR family transcriptional regulator [Haloarchaeobius amylolyticus]|uniref:ArsR family transcriptional regulator n=1 Tax=Haloarchaeobius amylolyticus TaxID=1198296 RepID=A0ABD6BGY8_9EURY
MSSDAHIGDDAPGPLIDVPAECYEVLRSPHRLRVLEVLGRRDTRLPPAELTTALVDRMESDLPTGQARHEVRISLAHNHLPRLEDAGLVDWAEAGVALVDDPPVQPAAIASLLELCEDEHAETLLEALVDPIRMCILSVLEETDRPLSLEQLATHLGAHVGGPFCDVERAAIALHHSHLPAMADVGVVSYDPDSKLITRDDESIPIVQ